LEERTRRIDKIVDAIVMVTVQTKMLAVNGNVEAARAGEYGRGFSVVAGDIRSLANESSENADKIKDLVRNVQTQISKVASDIQIAGNKARQEVEKAKVSTTNLDLIVKDCELIVAGIKDVSKGSMESLAALEQRARPASRLPAPPKKPAEPAPKAPAPPSRLSRRLRRSRKPLRTSPRRPTNCRTGKLSIPIRWRKTLMQNPTAQELTASKEESQLVTFLLKDEEFGFDIMSVQEIIRLPKMAKVPRTPPYVEGIANLRGVVLPIIDMRTRFGMERTEETDRTRVLVIDIDGVKTGLRVDRVKQVTRVLRSDVDRRRPPFVEPRPTTWRAW